MAGFGAGIDVVTLGIRVDASEVRDATGAVADLGTAGARTEQTTQRLTSSANAMGRGMGTVAYSLERVAVSAGGVNARLARTVTVMSQFAPSATLTIGILSALALIAVAFRQIGKDAREAAEDAEEAFQRSLELLNKIADANEDQLPGAVGQVRQRLFAAQAELGQIPDTPFGEYGRRRRELEATIAVLQRAEAAGAGAVLDNTIKSMVDHVTLLTDAIRINMAAFELSPLAGIAGEDTGILGGIGAGPSDAALHRARQAFYNSEAFGKLAEEQQLLLREQLGATEDLGDANYALIRSLENVGRAYGGVIDQILALSAATLRLSGSDRMPGFGAGQSATFKQAAAGYGTAALGGVGFGASTGSPVAGAIGGAISGFAVAGPAGAIVGAVSGIVSGLIESGRRAREAQRMWEVALRAFDLMFDDLTPLEEDLAGLDAAFARLSGGRTIEEFIAWTAELELAASKGVQGLHAQIEANNRLIDSYERNRLEAEALAVAEDALADARFRVLNAPSGFNPNQYGFDYGAIGVPDTGGSGDGGIIIQGDMIINTTGMTEEEIAAAVLAWIKRNGKRGGPIPYSLTTR